MTPDRELGPKKIMFYLLLLLLVVASLLMYFQYRESQTLISNLFTESRGELAQGSLSNIKEELELNYSYLFKDCEDRSLYDKYIDSDSRKLSATELKRALELHNDCGDYFANKSNFIVDLFDAKLLALEEKSKLFGPGEYSRNAEIVTDYWREIYKLEKEKAILYSRLVDIQEEYWKLDLDKSLQIISSEAREAAVGALNFEANQKLRRNEEILKELKEARRIEALFWSESFGDEDNAFEDE